MDSKPQGENSSSSSAPIDISRHGILSPKETHRHTELQRLNKSELRYRRLFESAHDGILILDPETRKITDANPCIAALLGYSKSQLLGKELWEIGLLKDEEASSDADISERKQSKETLRQSFAELRLHAEELDRFNRVAVGRELRMAELKMEVNALCQQVGEPARYLVTLEPDGKDPMAAQAESSKKIPSDGLVPLESVLCTEELLRRTTPPPDYDTENRALVFLTHALAESPRTILQTLTDKMLEVFQVGSAGVSLLRKDDAGERFYWPAISGAWKSYIGDGTPRAFSPCGDVLDRNAPLLFRNVERRYTYFQAVTPPVREALLVPFCIAEKPVGTLWAVVHDDRRKFNAEDMRQLLSLGRFASSAYRTVVLSDDLEQQGEALRQSEAQMTEIVGEVMKANVTARDSRRAALNLMEDAVRSRQAMEALNVALRQSEERYRSLFASAPMAVFVCDRDGVIQQYNERAVELWGREPACGLEKHCGSIKLWLPNGILLPHDQSPLVEVLKSGRPARNVEVLIERPDGSRLPVLVNFAALKNARGEITGAITSFTDITERKQAEEILRLAQVHLTHHANQLEVLVSQRTAELTGTNKQLEALVYSIAHDLRAPLRAMQGFSELLVEEADATMGDTGRDFANRINQSAAAMDALLRDLLDFSHVSQQPVELVSMNLQRVIESVLSYLQKDIQEKKARVESSGPWPAVRAHEPILAQVLFHLISNALKFIAPDTPPVVRLGAEQREEFVRIWVEDNGLGIDPEYQDQIFRLFVRLHGEKYPGTGVGLAVVQKGVERMGGRVGVESTPGRGSRFWFELPRS